MDHYAELLVAHVHNGGGRAYADGIELQAITSEQQRWGSPFISGLPVDIEADLCAAVEIVARGKIRWTGFVLGSDCACCNGDGEIPARGYDGVTRHVECPEL